VRRQARTSRARRGTEQQPVLYSKHGAVAVVSLNRPHVLNAYNLAMRDALFEILQAVRDDPEVRVMILRGNGAAFCSGGDICEFGSAASPVAARRARWQRDVWGLLRALPQVTIAAVHGWTVGGGLEMALLCDLCIAAEDARFAYPETGLGMIPGVGGTQTTPREVGLGRALDLVLTGRSAGAEEAVEVGIAVRKVPGKDLDRKAMQLARQISTLPPDLVMQTKRVVDQADALDLTTALSLEPRVRTSSVRCPVPPNPKAPARCINLPLPPSLVRRGKRSATVTDLP
jgi:enoyl-CoA hydratase